MQIVSPLCFIYLLTLDIDKRYVRMQVDIVTNRL